MTGSASVPGAAPALRITVVLAIAVAALGYFVDVFDILLFSVVRVASLRDLGVPAGEQLGTGLTLLSIQNAGLMIGGILFGIYGDRAGRRSVLFGSILLYSVANLANALVHSVPAYAALRFVAGLGLAGELGAGVTLVSEMMPTRMRGYGTAIIASVGLAGGLVAPWVGTSLPWRTAYVVGGVAGLTLLALRLAVHESPLFRSLAKSSVPSRESPDAAGLTRTALALLPGIPERTAHLVRDRHPRLARSRDREGAGPHRSAGGRAGAVQHVRRVRRR